MAQKELDVQCDLKINIYYFGDGQGSNLGPLPSYHLVFKNLSHLPNRQFHDCIFRDQFDYGGLHCQQLHVLSFLSYWLKGVHSPP